MKTADMVSASLSDLLMAYRAAAISYGEAIGNGRHRVANRSHDLAQEIHNEIVTRGGDAEKRVHALLTDAEPAVRLLVASHIVHSAPSTALETLEALAAGPPAPIQLMASIALSEARRRGRS